jgi:hypothetical protein
MLAKDQIIDDGHFWVNRLAFRPLLDGLVGIQPILQWFGWVR